MLLYHISSILIFIYYPILLVPVKLFCGATGKRSLRNQLVKTKIHPDPKYLMPDAIETLKATEALAKLGFIVLPY
jgi:hypothetical protein